MEGGFLQLFERVILDGDAVLEGAVHVALVALPLLMGDLGLEPVGADGGEDLRGCQRR